ncbi:putative ligase (homolog to O-succinylbenzoate--CoA ligase) [Natrialba magadii ATCC 43099]|uniref:Ligase (Homolog to O-succinylbenzoate--CoA ligase) n=1 Tax=Natrialba magadii (strain ATCC 43099 / DSM 3394 / CCM 3739 / CIP 104546 / IAM 13178 / JCM 8861 / NBRC 102185 / NCIMB 2190 / MS3) TaxID=547559 RepID=D3SV67_NATMM|nr:class I adenylate-forming enzyme family protein [Natrialba magadii]ADD05475.2 putative ligase (homolog to O-succinylbenzoate--CoA ligase) [Natrialba magadii ATCC 43099]
MTLSLAKRAERFPDRTAVVDISEERLYAPAETIHEDRLTYAGLSTLADWFGARLGGLGIEAGDTVCLVSRNRVTSLALLFACRRLGATLAPISHLLTPITVERPFDVLDPALVVAEPAQRDLVRSIPFDRSVTLPDLADAEPAERWRAHSDASGPLLALHGDDGQPIVTFSARTLESNCIAAVLTWGLTQDTVAPIPTPLSAPDGLVRLALPVLYAGGRLLLDRAFDPGDALTAMAAENATHLSGRTSVFRDLAGDADSAFTAALEPVRCVLPDATVDPALLDPYRNRGIPVSRVYGVLECPMILAGSDVASGGFAGTDAGDGRDEAAEAASIGRPILDCRVRLVGSDGAAVEGAGSGTLEVRGPVVADGRRGGETAGSQPVGRWVDTGQLFDRDENGRYALE